MPTKKHPQRTRKPRVIPALPAPARDPAKPATITLDALFKEKLGETLYLATRDIQFDLHASGGNITIDIHVNTTKKRLALFTCAIGAICSSVIAWALRHPAVISSLH